jgi:hypothetical protein
MLEQEHLYVTVGSLFLDGWSRVVLSVSAISAFSSRRFQTPGQTSSGNLLLSIERRKKQTPVRYMTCITWIADQ